MATLFIDRNASYCGACQRGADPKEESHETVLSWSGPEKGCGVLYTEVASHYVGGGIEDRVREMRPDLPWSERKA
jgi:hypothetical protein